MSQHILQSVHIEKRIRAYVEKHEPVDFLDLADSVTRSTGASVQLVERVLRMLIQEQVLELDDNFKVVLRKSDGRRQGSKHSIPRAAEA